MIAIHIVIPKELHISAMKFGFNIMFNGFIKCNVIFIVLSKQFLIIENIWISYSLSYVIECMNYFRHIFLITKSISNCCTVQFPNG